MWLEKFRALEELRKVRNGLDEVKVVREQFHLGVVGYGLTTEYLEMFMKRISELIGLERISEEEFDFSRVTHTLLFKTKCEPVVDVSITVLIERQFNGFLPFKEENFVLLLPLFLDSKPEEINRTKLKMQWVQQHFPDSKTVVIYDRQHDVLNLLMEEEDTATSWVFSALEQISFRIIKEITS